MNNRVSKYLLVLFSIALFVGFSFYLFVYIGPNGIVDFFGTRNSYIVMFATAIFGGFTTLNVIPYHPLLVTLAAGGLNPLFLGVLAALGVSLGDSTSYLLGYHGRVFFQKKSKWFDRIHKLSGDYPRKFMFICLLYSTFLPLSNDLLTIPAGLARIPFFRIMIPLLIGNILFDIALAFLSSHYYSVVEKWFL